MSFKAHDKRVKTLLVEYKNQFKGNNFNDKRIGENDKNMSLEDKMFKRFVTERQKSKDRKGSKFNLNDDDESGNKYELTHYGQSLSQIERFERVQMSDDDEDDENDPDRGKINADFVSKNFFGGFKDNNDDQEGKRKNRKEWIEEMIAKSKTLKYERQKERDRTLDMTEELDKEWRQIMPLIGKMDRDLKREEDTKAPTNTKPDDYDVLVRSLQFESAKATPSNKLKTPEDLEKERQEALSKNEKELRDRMTKEVEELEEDEDTKRKKKGLKKVSSNHISADDIEFDDPEYLDMIKRDELSKKHKQMNEDLEKARREEDEKEEEEEGEEEDGDEEKEESEEEDEDEEAEIGKSEDGDFKNEKWVKNFENICLKMNQNSIDLKQFEGLLKTLLEKLDPSKDDNNKKRICFLTKHLITYYQSLFKFTTPSKLSIDMQLVNLLTKYIYDLTMKYGNKSTKKDPSPYVEIFKTILTDLNKEFLNLKVSERRFPHLDTLFTFKLISNVFPTSDFRHQIVTPCLLIMSRYLIECQIHNIGDLFRGIFLVNLCYEFVNKAQRYIPECVQFLNGVLYLFSDLKNSGNGDTKSDLSEYELSTIYESFKRTKVKFSINKKSEKLTELSLVNLSANEKTQIDDSTKCTIVSYCIDLLLSYSKMYQDMVSFREIFSLTKKLLDEVKSDNNPLGLNERIIKLSEFIEETNKTPREHLKCLVKRPIVAKQHEPKIQSKTKFDPRHHNSVISEKQLLTKKYKKEMKSAIKEIRQDNQFLARVQLQEQMEKDAKRSQKVKEIMGSLANQEGEYQKAKRQKN